MSETFENNDLVYLKPREGEKDLRYGRIINTTTNNVSGEDMYMVTWIGMPVAFAYHRNQLTKEKPLTESVMESSYSIE